MRHVRFALTFALGLALAASSGGWAQDLSTDAAGDATGATAVDMSVILELNVQWGEVEGWISRVSGAFDTIRMLAYTGFATPEPSMGQEHVAQIFQLLEGPAEPAAAPSRSATRALVDPGYLLGEGGHFEQLAAALGSYMAFLEPYSEDLADYYEAKYLAEHAEDYWEGIGKAVLSSRLAYLDRLAQRAAVLAQLALDAALRVDAAANSDEQVNGFMSIYASAVAAVGYWPILTGGSLPSPDTLPSTLLDLRNIFERVDRDLGTVLGRALRDS
jgi:hypothetical protein